MIFLDSFGAVRSFDFQENAHTTQELIKLQVSVDGSIFVAFD